MRSQESESKHISMLPMATVAFATFPISEIKMFNALCVDHSLDPLLFFVCARMPPPGAGVWATRERVVHVEYGPTTRTQDYAAASGQKWLAAFGRELRSDYYTKD